MRPRNGSSAPPARLQGRNPHHSPVILPRRADAAAERGEQHLLREGARSRRCSPRAPVRHRHRLAPHVVEAQGFMAASAQSRGAAIARRARRGGPTSWSAGHQLPGGVDSPAPARGGGERGVARRLVAPRTRGRVGPNRGGRGQCTRAARSSDLTAPNPPTRAAFAICCCPLCRPAGPSGGACNTGLAGAVSRGANGGAPLRNGPRLTASAPSPGPRQRPPRQAGVTGTCGSNVGLVVDPGDLEAEELQESRGGSRRGRELLGRCRSDLTPAAFDHRLHVVAHLEVVERMRPSSSRHLAAGIEPLGEQAPIARWSPRAGLVFMTSEEQRDVERHTPDRRARLRHKPFVHETKARPRGAAAARRAAAPSLEVVLGAANGALAVDGVGELGPDVRIGEGPHPGRENAPARARRPTPPVLAAHHRDGVGNPVPRGPLPHRRPDGPTSRSCCGRSGRWA